MPGAQIAPNPRARLLEIVERLDRVERWLADGLTPRQASAKARETMALSRWTANRYVAAALKRLHDDGQTEPIESKRARMVATLNSITQRALANQRTYEQDGEVKVYDAPDFKAALGAQALLAEIQSIK